MHTCIVITKKYIRAKFAYMEIYFRITSGLDANMTHGQIFTHVNLHSHDEDLRMCKFGHRELNTQICISRHVNGL